MIKTAQVVANNQDLIPDLVRRAVECVLRGEYNAARSALGSIDFARLISDRKAALRRRRARLTRRAVWDNSSPDAESQDRVALRHLRTAPADSMKLATFERDHFICRYEHCRKRTIHIPVLRALSSFFPDILTYNSDWRPLEDHILYWTYGTSLEHRISFPHGGTSDPENLITACYQCNDIKNMIRASDLGWEVSEIQEGDWDGLNGYLPALNKVGPDPDRPLKSNHPLDSV